MSIDHPFVVHVAHVHHMSFVTHFSAAYEELYKIQSESHEKHKRYIEGELKIGGIELFYFARVVCSLHFIQKFFIMHSLIS